MVRELRLRAWVVFGMVTMAPLLAACGPPSPGECPELVHDGGLNPTSLQEVEALPRYTEVTGSLALSQVVGLRDLEAFSCLRSVGGISLEGNPDVETIEGLEHVEHVPWMYIQDNERLQSLEGLEKLRVVRNEIQIQGNPALRTIGMRALEEVYLLQIGQRTAMGSEVMYDMPGEWGYYHCAPNGNAGLTEIDGLDGLTRFGVLRVYGNASLVSIDALGPIAARAVHTLPDEDSVLRPLVGEKPIVGFQANPQLSAEHIEAVWASVDPDGATLGDTCGNKEEEPCICWNYSP